MATPKKPIHSPPPQFGQNVATVQAFISSLKLSPQGEALASLALTLAGSLDSGAGLAVAAVSRELRATLEELGSEDDADSDAIPGLSAPVVDS